MEKSLQPCLWNLNSPVAPSQLSCQISVVQCQAEVSANVRKKNIGKHVKTHTKGNDIITNVISANRQHSISTFSIFKFQRCSSKLSVLFPSCRQGALVPLLTGNLLNRMSFWKWCLKHWWGEHWECLFFFLMQNEMRWIRVMKNGLILNKVTTWLATHAGGRKWPWTSEN